MPRFKGGASGLSPLAIQLTPTPFGGAESGAIEVVGFYAAVEADPAVATTVSRPILSRPSTIGIPAGGGRPVNIIGITNPAAVSHSEVLTAYGVPPSFPSVSPFTTLGPWGTEWAADSGGGLIVLPQDAILLYGIGGAWSGYLEWDEP